MALCLAADLSNIVRAVTVLAIGLLVVDYILVAPNLYGFFFFGKITIALYWLLQLFLLGGPRLAYRYLKYAQSKQSAAREATMPTLLLGRGVDVEVVLRGIETGAIRKLRPVGILSPREADVGQSIRGVRVGPLADLERIALPRQPSAARRSAASLPPPARWGRGAARIVARPRPQARRADLAPRQSRPGRGRGGACPARDRGSAAAPHRGGGSRPAGALPGGKRVA